MSNSLPYQLYLNEDKRSCGIISFKRFLKNKDILVIAREIFWKTLRHMHSHIYVADWSESTNFDFWSRNSFGKLNFTLQEQFQAFVIMQLLLESSCELHFAFLHGYSQINTHLQFYIITAHRSIGFVYSWLFDIHPLLVTNSPLIHVFPIVVGFNSNVSWEFVWYYLDFCGFLEFFSWISCDTCICFLEILVVQRFNFDISSIN